jgi:hypothetical protein
MLAPSFLLALGLAYAPLAYAVSGKSFTSWDWYDYISP